MKFKRREVLPLIAVAPLSIPSSLTGCKKKKRMGSFEESARAVVVWLEKNRYRTGALEFEKFREGLDFEMDHNVNSFIQLMASGRVNYFTLVKKGCCILECNRGTYAFFGDIKKQGKLNDYDVFSLDEVVGIDPQKAANTMVTKGETRIFLYENKIEEHATVTRERLLSKMRPLISRRVFEITKQVVEKDSVDFNELHSLSLEMGNISRTHPLMVLTKIAAMRLRPGNNDINSKIERKKTVQDYRLSMLVHELTHAELPHNLPRKNHEVFCFLSQLAFCRRVHFTLADVMVVATGGMPDHVFAAREVLRELSKEGFGFKETLGRPPEEKIRGAALRILDRLSYSRFNKPFGQVVDVSVFKKAKEFAKSVN